MNILNTHNPLFEGDKAVLENFVKSLISALIRRATKDARSQATKTFVEDKKNGLVSLQR